MMQTKMAYQRGKLMDEPKIIPQDIQVAHPK
jgi:hypothetical protein